MNKAKFIINTSVEYFSDEFATVEKQQQQHKQQHKQLSEVLEFLENDEYTVLSASLNKKDQEIHFQYHISDADDCLLFYKIPKIANKTQVNSNSSSSNTKVAGIQQENTSDKEPTIGILTLEGGLIKSIYNSVSQVFHPHANAQAEECNQELNALLENLHVSLAATLGLPRSGITSLKDEIQYWQNKVKHKSSARVEREKAQVFYDALQNMQEQITSIISKNQNRESLLEECFDALHTSFDDLWCSPYLYPQERMADLMNIIGQYLMHLSLRKLYKEDLLNLYNPQLSSLLSQSIDNAESWLQLCDSLTRLFWPNYTKHPWLGAAHLPTNVKLIKERLQKIRNLRKLYQQIAALLDYVDLKGALQIPQILNDVNLCDISDMAERRWQKILKHFEDALQPIDESVAEALKHQLMLHLQNPRQQVYIFTKYEKLIQRPMVLELLTAEREQFVESLYVFLQDIRKAINEVHVVIDGEQLSAICNECRWLKMVQHQIQDVEKILYLMDGRENYLEIVKAVQETKEETESLLRTNYEIWYGQYNNAIKTGDLKLEENQPVVTFEKGGRQLMRVTFNPKFVTFCEDVSEFERLGFNISDELRSAATNASKYLGIARQLQQIANFHNTIGDTMIPCQRPIMLKNAIELSKLVRSETVTWNNEEAVQKYVSTLQVAVAKLSTDNTLLVGYHEQAKSLVIKLMDTDLIKQMQNWKDEMRNLRELIASLERKGFTNLDAFKLYWDYQLYKVLEYQYILGLVNINHKLPNIYVKITFRQRRLCFIPPEEEIREKYFIQLRRFIERPYGFRGLSDKSVDLFKTMIGNNRHYFGPLYAKAGNLFERLTDFKKLWLPWVGLGYVDVDELCSIHLQTANDWERNFRKCKHFSQKIAKIQNTEEIIDCIVIDIQQLRSDIEAISRRYWEALCSSLKNSLLNDIALLQEFLQNAIQFLQNINISDSSLSESGMKYEKIISELPEMTKMLEMVKAKDVCLAGWCKERVSALNNLLSQWEKFQPLLDNHSIFLERQITLIKDQMRNQMENLHNEAEKFIIRWEAVLLELESSDNVNLDSFKECHSYWQQILARKSEVLEEYHKFNISCPAQILENFEEISSNVEQQSKQWFVYNEYLLELHNVLKEEWVIYCRRPYLFNEFLSKWQTSMHSSVDLSSLRIRQSVEQYENILPILQQLKSDALTERHWMQILVLLEMDLKKPIYNLILADVISNPRLLVQNASQIAKIIRCAMAEQVVRQSIMELDQWSVTTDFKLISHTDSTNNTITLIKNYQEVLSQIGDNQSLLQSAKNSTNSDTFLDQSDLWENKLNLLDSILTSLNQVQRRWLYLEPVFSAGTLGTEAALFKRIDKDFRFIMQEIQADSRVVSLIKIHNISSIVKSMESQLAHCQNNLITYIMEKRNIFPRFYFLGNDDLLELLGQASKDINIIQKHIRKLLPGCSYLRIIPALPNSSLKQESVMRIEALEDLEGDVLHLIDPVEMLGPIELWLNSLVNSVKATLKEHMIQCHSAYTPDGYGQQVLNDYVCQVLSTVRAIHFTKQAEKAIQSMTLEKLRQQLNNEINKYANWKHQTLNTQLNLKLRSLLFDLVHYVTVVELLIQQNVVQLNDWYWLAQLRFYLKSGDSGSSGVSGGGGGGCGIGDCQTVYGRMVYAEFEYSYEFLGHSNKLVSTRLTHKCYLVLTQAMHMGLGGNPFGPAGTGKTECVKALGAMLGRLVLVFNCDENVDATSMDMILTGLVRCGAWGCFDEFNRLQESTLSTISMLIQPIQTALKNKSPTVHIAEKIVEVNPHCGIFVTLNPVGTEYGGRQKLPGNIQALFRPIVMQQPESQEIARVMLYVEGFKQADDIAERMEQLCDICSKVLTKQRHYDWGLRQLKSVLLASGKDLQNYLTNNVKHPPSNPTQTNDDLKIVELRVAADCLRRAIVSKLLQQDVAWFELLLQNLFPELKNSIQETNFLEQTVKEVYEIMDLHFNEKQMLKVLQLYEQLQQRLGVVVVGPPGCGKTTIIKVLQQTLMKLRKQQIRLHIIHPKAMSRIELLGHLSADTRQWMDGVLTHTAALVCNQAATDVHSWILCDGSIDPDWIEALNSVLDDNRLLTLPSGWRIQFGNNVNLIFETDDMENASPATISRLAILNINTEDYPLVGIIKRELSKFNSAGLFDNFMEQVHDQAVTWIEKQCAPNAVHLTPNSILRALLFHLRFCCGINTTTSNELKDTNMVISGCDEFAVLAFQAACEFLPTQYQNEFANWLYKKSNIYIANPQNAELTYFNRSTATIEMYEEQVSNLEDKELLQTSIVTKNLATLKKFLTASANTTFLLVGPVGSAKTLLLQKAVQQIAGYDLITINCSTQLTPANIIQCIKKNCLNANGARGREFRAKRKRLVLYLKNLNLCQIDNWGCNTIGELLLQLVQRQGFYNTDSSLAASKSGNLSNGSHHHSQNNNFNNYEWLHINHLQICGSVSHGATNNNCFTRITPRYLAINRLLHICQANDNEMRMVLQHHLSPFLVPSNNGTCQPHFDGYDLESVSYFANGLMEFYRQVVTTFGGNSREAGEGGYGKKTALHYEFSPKFIIAVIKNLKYYPSTAFEEALYYELLLKFKDRLNSHDDEEQFDSIMRHSLRKIVGREKIYFAPKSLETGSELHPIQHDEWLAELQKFLLICNTENFVIEMPITEDLLDQTAKLICLLSRPQTHIIIVGAAGSRILDTIYLVASKQQSHVQLLEDNVNYNLQDFFNNLKTAAQTAAVENKPVYLVVEHYWLNFLPSIWHTIEAILQKTDITDLFGDEIENLAATLKHTAQLEGYQDNMMSYFSKRVESNLHLVICLDSASPQINEYFQKYPVLYRNTEIICIKAASKENYATLPKSYIQLLNEEYLIEKKDKVPVSSYISELAIDLLKQQPPIRFHKLIKSYYHLYINLSKNLNSRLEKLENGVKKLATAHALVETLKSDAFKQEEALGAKRQMANEALEMISATMRNANEQKTNMLELQQQTQINSERLKQRQIEIQKELAEVEPVLKEASAAVGQIKAEALSEIRSLRAPPETIRDILEGVLRLMGIRDTSWNSMKIFLAKRGVKEDIRSLDPAHISPENCTAVDKLLAAKSESFEMKNAKRASAAAAPLASWVKASVGYAKVIQSIKPLEREQSELQQHLQLAENELKSLLIGLDDVDNRVKQLSNKLNTYTQEAAVLEIQLNEARHNLQVAEVLVEQLSSEFHLWSQQMDEYRTTHKILDIKALVLAIALNYFSHMSPEIRKNSMISIFKILDQDETFDICKYLLSEQEQIIWESMGLARDAEIIENAILLTQMLQLPYGSYPIPLLMDPSNTVRQWLESYLQSKNRAYEFTISNTKRLNYIMELAIRFGKVLVVENCQYLTISLMQLISNKIFMKYSKKQIIIGTKSIDLHEQFQLVIITRTNKCLVPAEIGGYLTSIPFIVTAPGLSQQLLSKTISLKNPDLERKRIELLKNESDLLKKRLQLEDKLLEELSRAEGDLLKNALLVKTLNEIKDSSSIIDQSLKESAVIKSSMLADYSNFQELCCKSSQFFIDLSAVYDFTSEIFKQLFVNIIEVYNIRDVTIGEKCYSQLVHEVFQYLARGLSKDRHLALALFISRTAFQNLIPNIEWELFVTNFLTTSTNVTNTPDIGASSKSSEYYIQEEFSKEANKKLQILFDELPELKNQFFSCSITKWQQFSNGTTNKLPVNSMAQFEQVIMVQILRPDLLTQYIRLLVESILGIKIETIQHPSIEQLVSESSNARSILMITGNENDPTSEIYSLALRQNGTEKYQELSVGQGMESKAKEVLKQSAESGKWLCLKNIHLMPNWLLDLERIFMEVEMNEDFRLWLICESAEGLNETVLYNCVKVLFESPSGIKQKVKKLLQTYATIEQDHRILGESKLMKMRVVLFILISVLQERRRFIPQGWSQRYEFNEADLKAGLQLLKWMDDSITKGQVNWTLVQKLFENIIFGGRISNKKDLAVLQNYLQQYFHNAIFRSGYSILNDALILPTSNQWSDYLDAVAKLPTEDDPALFRLSQTANINRNLEYAEEVLNELRAAHFGNDRIEGNAKMVWEKQLKPIFTVWKSLAVNSSVSKTVQELRFDCKELTSPWLLFLRSEMQTARDGYQLIHSTLSNIYGTTKGKQSATGNYAEQLQTLISHQVPTQWQSLWSGPANILDYLRAFMTRAEAAEKRLRTSKELQFADEIDLSKVFNAQTLITVFQLTISLKQQISFKNLVMKSQISDRKITKHQQLIIKPLKISGGIFQNNHLVITPSRDKQFIEEKSPEFELTFIEKSTKLLDNFNQSNLTKMTTKNTNDRLVKLPLYTNDKREKLLCELDVLTNESMDTILLSGAALIVPDY